jgi:DNA ligase 1
VGKNKGDTMTKTFKPLLAETADMDTIRFPLIASAKIDGIRCLVDPVLGPVSRKLKPIPNHHVRETLKDTGYLYLDGEVVTFTDGKMDDFNTVQSKVMSENGRPDFKMMVFDHFRNPTAPYTTRLAAAMAIPANSHVLVPHDYCYIADMAELMAFEQKCVDDGWEGIMTRDPAGRYKFGRSTAKEQILLKIKRSDRDEAVITGMVERMHNANEATKDAIGQTKRSNAKDGLVPTDSMGALNVRWRGLEFEIGTGFTEDQRVQYWQRRADLLGSTVTFQFQGVGSKGRPRFPVFVGFRYDLEAA